VHYLETQRANHNFYARKLLVAVIFFAAFAAAQEQPVVIRAGTVLDGKGKALHNVLIVVQSGKIVRAEQNAKDQMVQGAAFYDLSR